MTDNSGHLWRAIPACLTKPALKPQISTMKEKENKRRSKIWIDTKFGRIFIEDADPLDSFKLSTIQKDWDLGIVNDRKKCAYARSAARHVGVSLAMFGSLGGEIFNRIAYIPTPDEHAQTGWILKRFRMNKDTMLTGKHTSVVKAFDKGAKIKQHQAVFRAPSETQTLNGKRESNTLRYDKLIRSGKKHLTGPAEYEHRRAGWRPRRGEERE